MSTVTREARMDVRWGVWLATVIIGFALLSTRTEGPGSVLSRVPLYTFQGIFLLAATLSQLARHANPRHLPWSIALLCLCLAIEAKLVSDSRFLSGLGDVSDLYVVMEFGEDAYFMVLLPWAAGLALGALGALLLKHRYGQW